MSLTSPAFEDRIIAVHGQTGQKWLNSLPELQEKLVQRWSMSNIQPIQDLSYNYLAFASIPKYGSVVLKLGVPHQELETEIQALQEFNGNGIVRLLKADSSQGALLLERILPGDNLLSIQDDHESTRIAARLMAKIWKPAPSKFAFPSAGDWCQGFQGYLENNPDNGPLPADLVNDAANLAKELLSTSQNKLLLHGDLHHMNILLGENENWVAIDPKGVVGEAAFEVGALMLNPVPNLVHWPDLEEVQEHRLTILAEELRIEQEQLASWSFVRAVLSAVWSLGDGQDWNYGINVAEVLRELI
ncbi:MAG TPA: hypothetical protein ENF27_02745 [Chloroflexi bacterium]|nr:hypothetical protein [Chloroflexota bacterium]